MTLRNLTRATLMTFLALTVGFGCKKKIEEVLPSTSEPFTAADIEKAWTSNCIAGSEILTNGIAYKTAITFNTGGNFNSYQTWYSTAGCTVGTSVAAYGISGTYSVGTTQVGSAQLISFALSASDVMPTNVTAQNDINSDCGMSSPFDAGGAHPVNASNNGGHFSTFMATCAGTVLPNSGNDDVKNLATFDGTILTVGAPAFGIPGVFSGGTAAAASIPLH